MTQHIRLGVLDFCNVFPGMRPADAIEQTLDLAQLADSLGYSRYWLAEHHTPEVAHAAPEILLPVIAGLTERIRVGTAGVLLNFYSPYKVAETFLLLQLMFPERVDLGLARGRVSELIDPLLRYGSAEGTDYETRLTDLLELLHARRLPVPSPLGIRPPAVWTLGTNTTSMELAAKHGLAFCLSLFLKPPDSQTPEIIAAYRRQFQPSQGQPAPSWSIAVAGVCSESEADARAAMARADLKLHAAVLGTPAQCRAQLLEIAEQYQTREIILVDLCPDWEERKRCYQRLAAVMELSQADP